MAKACPVNFQKVNENQIRFQAIFVAITAIIFAMSNWIVLPLLLIFDFFSKLFISQKLSPFAMASTVGLKIFNIKNKSVDSAPKIFASHLGLIFSVIIFIAAIFGFEVTASIVAIILAVCASLEAVFNYCLGCKIYAILHKFNLI